VLNLILPKGQQHQELRPVCTLTSHLRHGVSRFGWFWVRVYLSFARAMATKPLTGTVSAVAPLHSTRHASASGAGSRPVDLRLLPHNFSPLARRPRPATLRSIGGLNPHGSGSLRGTDAPLNDVDLVASAAKRGWCNVETLFLVPPRAQFRQQPPACQFFRSSFFAPSRRERSFRPFVALKHQHPVIVVHGRPTARSTARSDQ